MFLIPSNLLLILSMSLSLQTLDCLGFFASFVVSQPSPASSLHRPLKERSRHTFQTTRQKTIFVCFEHEIFYEKQPQKDEDEKESGSLSLFIFLSSFNFAFILFTVIKNVWEVTPQGCFLSLWLVMNYRRRFYEKLSLTRWRVISCAVALKPSMSQKKTFRLSSAWVPLAKVSLSHA